MATSWPSLKFLINGNKEAFHKKIYFFDILFQDKNILSRLFPKIATYSHCEYTVTVTVTTRKVFHLYRWGHFLVCFLDP